MKKILISLFVILIFPLFFNPKLSVNAQDAPNDELYLVNESIQCLNDGSYIIIKTYATPVCTKGGRSFLVGNKECSKIASDGSIICKYTLTGYFEIDFGVSSSCYDTTYSTIINSNNWSYQNISNYYSGNTAYGEGKFERKLLFIVLETVNINLSVTCDIYGNIS